MKNISLIDLFEELIAIGRGWKPHKPAPKIHAQTTPQHVVTWQEEFNLTGWEGWVCEPHIEKIKISQNKTTQEVFIYGKFKKTSVLGSDNDLLIGVAITLIRNMPIKAGNDENISPFKKFDGMPWEITNLRYNQSPAKISVSPIRLI